jgi:hypothetical protein
MNDGAGCWLLLFFILLFVAGVIGTVQGKPGAAPVMIISGLILVVCYYGMGFNKTGKR